MVQAQNGDFSISNNLYDDSDVNGYSWANSRDAFETYLAPVFNTSTRYERNAFRNIYSSNGTTNIPMPYYYFVMLNNGTVLGFTKNGNYDGFRVAVIFNPQKKKLLTGRDVFELQYMSDEYDNGYAYNSILKRNYKLSNRQQYIDACKSNSAHPMYSMANREFCAFLIVENGFKVPKDYPVKL